MSPNNIQRKHRREREATVDDCLHHSLGHLHRADRHFEAAIRDRELRRQFAAGIGRARAVLDQLGIDG